MKVIMDFPFAIRQTGSSRIEVVFSEKGGDISIPRLHIEDLDNLPAPSDKVRAAMMDAANDAILKVWVVNSVTVSVD
jgi:hypothetical protein